MYNKTSFRLYKWRANFRRRRRLLFPSPAELRLIVLLGGQVWQVQWLRDPHTKFPLAFVLNRGKLLKAERVRREVRVGAYYLDFANDLGRGIEVDGEQYHMDKVAEFERDSYMYTRGWRIMRIPAFKLWLEPDKVQRDVMGFLIY